MSMSDNLLMFLVLVAAFTSAIFIGFGDRFWLWCKGIWDWCFNPDYIFGYEDRYTPTFTPNKQKCQPHLHQYAFYETTKHKWYLVGGKPKGTRNTLTDVIKATIDRPGHTETKLEKLLDWQKQGYDIVFTSWNRWRCKVCGEFKNTEFYTMPSKQDGSFMPIIYDLNRKKQTQVIPATVVERREIPVERMKKY